MVTAGSLPIPREVAVNTFTGPRAGGVSLGPLSEGPCWHSPWASMVSPLFRGIRGGCVNFRTSWTVTLKHHCVCPEVGPELAGLVESLAALHTDEVSLAGLCPLRPCSSVLRPRAADTPALVECGEVLWNVRLKDTEDVQAFLLPLSCWLLLDGV